MHATSPRPSCGRCPRPTISTRSPRTARSPGPGPPSSSRSACGTCEAWAKRAPGSTRASTRESFRRGAHSYRGVVRIEAKRRAGMSGAEWASAQLVAAARDGHVESLTALVANTHPHVLRFAHTLCASPQDAEDAAQEALLILYRKVGMLRSTTALSSWMFRIVRNECLRRLRSKGRDDRGGPAG